MQQLYVEDQIQWPLPQVFVSDSKAQTFLSSIATGSELCVASKSSEGNLQVFSLAFHNKGSMRKALEIHTS